MWELDFLWTNLWDLSFAYLQSDAALLTIDPVLCSYILILQQWKCWVISRYGIPSFFFQRLSYCRSSYIASTLVHSPTSHTCMYVHTHTLVHVVFRKAIKLLIVPTPNLVIFLVDFHHFFGVWQHVNYVLIVLVITHLFCRFWWLLCS